MLKTQKNHSFENIITHPLTDDSLPTPRRKLLHHPAGIHLPRTFITIYHFTLPIILIARSLCVCSSRLLSEVFFLEWLLKKLLLLCNFLLLFRFFVSGAKIEVCSPGKWCVVFRSFGLRSRICRRGIVALLKTNGLQLRRGSLPFSRLTGCSSGAGAAIMRFCILAGCCGNLYSITFVRFMIPPP